MNDIVIGGLGVLVGAVFCFRGYLTMRVVITLWGAFAGFLLGASLVARFAEESFLAGALAWAIGIAVALLFAFLAYTYYALSVIITMASIGFTLGSTVMVGLNIEWTWVIVLVGVIAGVLLAALAILANLPMVLLTLLTAAAGASALVGGIMFLAGAVDTTDLHQRTVVERIDDSPGWWILFVMLAVAGVVSQLRAQESARRDLREEWAHEGRRRLRPT